uniref:Adenylyl cyclase-associated protein n=1 Tax=Meloidogyne hapla TaxID=6305 RepID=A0A1I8B619_MELHA
MANKQSGGKDQGRQALFAELNKGDAVTSGLKKVTANMQTHKNPQLRTQSTVPADKGKSQKSVSPAGNAVVEKPPRIELKNQKVWEIEYHKDNRQIQIQADLKQSIYIFRCENSVIQIKGKANSVTVDSCKKTSVVFDALLSQVEIINCQSIELQTLGALPTISIQKTDGCQVYLSKESLGAEIVTSKSSEMNILVPKGADGDFSEFPVPEQFKTIYNIKENKLQTQVSDIV